MKKIIIGIIFLILTISQTFAAVQLSDLTEETINSKIEALSQSTTEDVSLSKQDLIKTLNLLKQYEETKAQTTKVQSAYQNANTIILNYKHKLEELQEYIIQNELPNLDQMSINEIQKLYNEALTKQTESKKNFEQQEKYNQNLLATTEVTQKSSQTLQDEIEKVNKILQNSFLRHTEREYYELVIQYANYKLDYQQFLNTAQTRLQEIVHTIKDYYKTELDYNSSVVAYYENKLNEITKEEAKKQQDKINEEINNVEVTKNEKSEFADKIVEENEQYRNYLNETIEKIDILHQHDAALTNALEATQKIETDIKSQIDTFAGSLYLAQTLYKQSKLLPTYKIDINLEESIGDVRLEQYDINKRLTEISNPDYIENIIHLNSQQLTEEQIIKMESLLEQQKKLLEMYNSKLSEALNILVNLKLKSTLLDKSKNTVKTSIRKELFWLQSNNPINILWFKNFPTMVKKELKDVHITFDTSNFKRQVQSNIFKICLTILISILVIFNRKNILNKISKLNILAAKHKTDNHTTATKAIFFAFLHSLNWPCLSIVIGWFLSYIHMQIGIYDIGAIVSENNLRIAFIILFLNFFNLVCTQGGINEIHFKRKYHKIANSHFNYFIVLLASLSLACTAKEMYLETLTVDVIGETIFFIILVSIFALLIKNFVGLLKSKNIENTLIKILYFCFCLIPLVLILMLWLGYFYSVIKISVRIIDTFFTLFVSIFIYRIIMKSVLLTQWRVIRKIKSEEAKKKYQEQNQNLEDTPNIQNLDQIDENFTVALSEQTVNILNITVFSIVGLILYFLWSDFIVVLSYLDTITLWTVSVIDPATNLPLPKRISISDLLIAIYTITLTFLLVKNLPNILEIIILNKFVATKNASYSIKTILIYILIAVGTSITLSKLGVGWDNLQWLIAALSVGLGFGLQEIFGNFVSGIIILFERPMRLGDLVTINNTTGFVTKIRIRATTILLEDKKELIVPNKTFITEPISNWVLSDTMTRIEVSIGAAYGSDLKQINEILLSIAKNCPYVMEKPEPIVYFTNFGDSSLDHMLYVYIKNIADRKKAMNYLNTEIYNKFNEHGIEIPFNQVEMFIKNTNSGQEIKIDQSMQKFIDQKVN